MRREYQAVLAACQSNIEAIDGLILYDESYLALEQLDRRRSSGEALPDIDEAGLRVRLAGEVARRRRDLAQISEQMREVLSRLETIGEATAATRPEPGLETGSAGPDAPSLIDALARAISEVHVPAFLETDSDPVGARTGRVASATATDGEPLRTDVLDLENHDGLAGTPGEALSRIEAACDDLTQEDPATDDLTRIAGIDTATAGLLSEAGVHSYTRIAAWTCDDIRSLESAHDLAPSRIAAEGWIEQAAVLAEGGTTHFAARKARGELQVVKAAHTALLAGTGAIVPLHTAGAARNVEPAAEPTGQTGAAAGQTNVAPEAGATIPQPAPAASASTVAPRASRLKRGLRHAVAVTATAILAFALMTAVEFAPDKLGTMAQMINPSVWAAVPLELH